LPQVKSVCPWHHFKSWLSPKPNEIGNKNKLAEVQQILKETPIQNQSLDLPELQGTRQEVAKAKVKAAFDIVKGPVLTEDTCLCFKAMGDLPGPYIKWFLGSLGHDGLLKMLQGFQDYSAFAVCTFAYMDESLEEPLLFEGITDGTIVSPRGPNHFGWDPIFQPEGFAQTYAEMDKALKNTLSHRAKALQKVQEFFSKKV
jgi:inosine triphosphate pyrophosphatase